MRITDRKKSQLVLLHTWGKESAHEGPSQWFSYKGFVVWAMKPFHTNNTEKHNDDECGRDIEGER